MKKILILIAFTIVPFFAMAQNTVDTKNKDVETSVKNEVVIKKVDPISINPKAQKDLNFKKNKDLISVRAYIKSLQLKRKETLMS